MLIITEKDLIMGRAALAVFQQCQHSPDCFFGNIEIECSEERCFLPRIRKDLEEASPSFTSLLRVISRYDAVASSGLLVSIQGNSEEKLKLVKESADLLRFAHFTFCTLMSLISAYGRIPNISQELIEKTLGDFSFEKTVRKMGRINHIWPYLLQASCFHFSKENHMYYRDKLFLITEFVLRAIDLFETNESNELFGAIEQYLKKGA